MYVQYTIHDRVRIRLDIGIPVRVSGDIDERNSVRGLWLA